MKIYLLAKTVLLGVLILASSVALAHLERRRNDCADQLNTDHKKWITVRPIAATSEAQIWEAYISPRKPSAWIGRRVKITTVGGLSRVGIVNAIEIDPAVGAYLPLRLRSLYLDADRLDSDRLDSEKDDGFPRRVAVSGISTIEVEITLVPTDRFRSAYQGKWSKDYKKLLRSTGKKLALYIKSSVFYDQFVLVGRITKYGVRPLEAVQPYLFVETESGEEVEVELETVNAYADAGER